MFTIEIPGYKKLTIENVVFDYNGTLACDGQLDPSVEKQLKALEDKANVFVLTSDTYGSVKESCKDLGVVIHVLEGEDSVSEKRAFVDRLDGDKTACIGNGYNDSGMFEIAVLSIIVVGQEGGATRALLQSDIMVKTPEDALLLLNNPTRIIATLRR